jgi:hypothetical protein
VASNTDMIDDVIENMYESIGEKVKEEEEFKMVEGVEYIIDDVSQEIKVHDVKILQTIKT